MIKKITGYSYNDITLVPSKYSDVISRSECNPFYNFNKLPIFASCMSTVVSINNYKEFEKNSITPIIPRNVDFQSRLLLMREGAWVAMSMNEFEEYFINKISNNIKDYDGELKVCIDVANGHMKKLYDLAIKAKIISLEHSYKLVIMTGNIANPETYQYICSYATYEFGDIKIRAIDYIRVSIGTGGQCTTTSNVSVHYPIASLIDECRLIKNSYKSQADIVCPMIVADGGIRNYNDIIKALALGADFVMVGTLFASMYESASPLLIQRAVNYGVDLTNTKYDLADYQYTNEDKKRADIINRQLYKECYGMSTKKAQSLINPNSNKKTAEGKHSIIPVKYTLKQWTENLIDYLKSAMSYCNSKTLNDFIGKQTLIVNSVGTISSVNK